jgi:hypothetical protein
VALLDARFEYWADWNLSASDSPAVSHLDRGYNHFIAGNDFDFRGPAVTAMEWREIELALRAALTALQAGRSFFHFENCTGCSRTLGD